MDTLSYELLVDIFKFVKHKSQFLSNKLLCHISIFFNHQFIIESIKLNNDTKLITADAGHKGLNYKHTSFIYDAISVPKNNKIKYLRFSPTFNDYIDDLNDDIVYLNLNHMNKTITKLPSKLKKLLIGDYFNAEIKEFPKYLNYLVIGNRCKNNLPEWPMFLTHLTIPYDYPFKIEKWPMFLSHLVLGRNYNGVFETWPTHLTHLVILDKCLARNKQLPDSLKFLKIIHLPFRYECRVKIVIPKQLSYLQYNTGSHICPDNLSTIEKISFEDSVFDGSLLFASQALIHTSIKSLNLNVSRDVISGDVLHFMNNLNDDCFPSLLHLKIRIQTGNLTWLPKNLIHLTFINEKYFDEIPEITCLHQSKLIFLNMTNIYENMVLPSSLTHFRAKEITFCRYTNYPPSLIFLDVKYLNELPINKLKYLCFQFSVDYERTDLQFPKSLIYFKGPKRFYDKVPVTVKTVVII